MDRPPRRRERRWSRLDRFLVRLRVQPVDECLRFRTPCGLRRAYDEIRSACCMLAAERRDQLALRNQMIDQGAAAERYALPVDGRLHQQVVLVEADHAGRSWLGNADRSEPLGPVEPGIPSTISVELEQHVAGEVFGLL